MNNSKLFDLLSIVFFISSITIIFISINFFTKYDILLQHDLVFSYGRTFFEPEHGRYIATFFNNLFTETLPEYLNIHPNDFKPLFVSPFKAILVILMCLLIAFSAFILKEEKTKISKIIFSPSFTISFAITFLTIFNNSFFDKIDAGMSFSYFLIPETTVFFEYSCSLIAFITFICYLAYFYINNKTPNKTNFIILYLCAFFTSLSIDPINIPTFIIISVLGLISVITNRRNLIQEKRKLFSWFGIYITYILGLVIYFARPNHHTVTYGEANNLIEYVKIYFIEYLNGYTNVFLKELFLFLVPILVLSILIYFVAKLKSKPKGEKLVFFIAINIFSLLLFYFMLFFLGKVNGNLYIILYPKCLFLCKVITYFFFVMTIGAFIDIVTLNQKTSNIIKSLLGIILIISFHQILLIDNIQNIQQKQKEMKNLRKSAYMIEKIIINEEEETVSIPEEFEKYKLKLFLDETTCSFFQYVKNVHPQVKLFNYKFKNNEKDYYYLFNDEELETLKFQNLLTHKMYRHKKQIIGCY